MKTIFLLALLAAPVGSWAGDWISENSSLAYRLQNGVTIYRNVQGAKDVWFLNPDKTRFVRITSDRQAVLYQPDSSGGTPKLIKDTVLANDASSDEDRVEFRNTRCGEVIRLTTFPNGRPDAGFFRSGDGLPILEFETDCKW